MPQLFPKSANIYAKLSIVLGALSVLTVLFVIALIDRSPYVTRVGVSRKQTVPFSHKHHVGGVGIDCRYCHTNVETGAFAGIPPVQTCMNCHSALFKDSDILEPVRESFKSGKPIEWVRVNDLPDYVYFNHSIHIQKGIGCVSCHGPVDKMPLMYKAKTLHMKFCLDCHRNPEKYVRPREEVMNSSWKPEESRKTLGPRLVKEYNIKKKTDCWVCHR